MDNKFDYDLRCAICAELTPSKRSLIKPFIKRVLQYDADGIKNYSSLEGLLLWLLERASKSQRQDFISEFDIHTIRVCDQCGKFMRDGYIVDDYLYFCSDECLHKRYTPDQYEALYDNDSAYWTDWRNYSGTPNWAIV